MLSVKVETYKEDSEKMRGRLSDVNVILSVIAVRGIDAEVDNGVLALDLLKLKTRLPEITRISIEQISGNVTKAPSEYGVLGTGLNEFG